MTAEHSSLLFFRTSTLIFSITAESYFCFLMEPLCFFVFFPLVSKFHFRELARLLYIRRHNQTCYFLPPRVSSTPRLIQSKISHIADIQSVMENITQSQHDYGITEIYLYIYDGNFPYGHILYELGLALVRIMRKGLASLNSELLIW